MPNTSNFSDRENARPGSCSISMTTSTPSACLQACPSPLTQNAAPPSKCDFVRKQFSCVRQTDNALTNQQQFDNLMLTPAPTIHRRQPHHPAPRDEPWLARQQTPTPLKTSPPLGVLCRPPSDCLRDLRASTFSLLSWNYFCASVVNYPLFAKGAYPTPPNPADTQ